MFPYFDTSIGLATLKSGIGSVLASSNHGAVTAIGRAATHFFFKKIMEMSMHGGFQNGFS
jgi:hypothetical protein